MLPYALDLSKSLSFTNFSNILSRTSSFTAAAARNLSITTSTTTDGQTLLGLGKQREFFKETAAAVVKKKSCQIIERAGEN
jgi:hypothetical protein